MTTETLLKIFIGLIILNIAIIGYGLYTFRRKNGKAKIVDVNQGFSQDVNDGLELTLDIKAAIMSAKVSDELFYS